MQNFGFIVFPAQTHEHVQKEESFEDSDNLTDPDVLAQDIAENLQAALEQFNSFYQAVGEV